MSVELTAFINGISPHVSGCPESLIINTVRDAIIRLCGDVTVWRDDIPAGNITILVDDYTITAPASTEIVSVVSLQYDETEIYPQTEEVLDGVDSGWRAGISGRPSAFVHYAPNRIKFNRIPNATIVGGLVARVALKPTRTATTVEDVLYNDWRECIEHGALERLFRIPKKAWSDINLAAYHGKHFSFHINKAKNRIISGNTQKSISVVMRRFI